MPVALNCATNTITSNRNGELIDAVDLLAVECGQEHHKHHQSITVSLPNSVDTEGLDLDLLESKGIRKVEGGSRGGVKGAAWRRWELA